jgi:hypothetical protein
VGVIQTRRQLERDRQRLRRPGQAFPERSPGPRTRSGRTRWPRCPGWRSPAPAWTPARRGRRVRPGCGRPTAGWPAP